jgi:hypothetical protein
MKWLEFNLRSKGCVKIDLDKCSTCSTHACIKACNAHLSGHVLVLKDGVPSLKPEYNKNAPVKECTECLACELDCLVYGKKAIKIALDMPELDNYVSDLRLHHPTSGV